LDQPGNGNGSKQKQAGKVFPKKGRVFRSRFVSSNAPNTEGVDVPAVDVVAFLSPRKSKVDIVQATGRAMRKSPSKERG